MRYVLIRSWHVIAFTDRGGAVRTRCGRRVAIEGTITGGPGVPIEVHATTRLLLLGDRSCETCLRLTLRDQEASVVENDPVGNEPPVEDDPVPG